MIVAICRYNGEKCLCLGNGPGGQLCLQIEGVAMRFPIGILIVNFYMSLVKTMSSGIQLLPQEHTLRRQLFC